MPTDTGDIVNKFLTEHFAQYVDYHFTAKLEDQLDEIANGKRQWIPVMDKFWKPFIKQVEEKEGIERAKFTTQELDETCPKCGEHKLQIKFGKMGRFVACAGYPECSYTRNVNETAEEAAERIAKAEAEQAELDGRECPKCGGRLVYKYSRTGSKFIGCANYPKCKHVEPLENRKTPASNARNAKKATSSNVNPVTANCFTVAALILTATTPLGTRPLQKPVQNAHGRF